MVTERQTQKKTIVVVIFVLLATIILLWSQSSSALPQVSFSVDEKWINEPVALSLAGPRQSEIYYTVDGSIPTVENENSVKYDQPLNLMAYGARVLTVRARAADSDGNLGSTSTKTYFIGMDSMKLPVLSLTIEPEDFYSADTGIYLNHQQRGVAWERAVFVSYVSANRSNGFDTQAGIRVHGGISRQISQKKSYRLYFRKQYGASRLVYPLFSEEGAEQFDQLVLHNSGQDLNLLRNALVDRLMRQMGGYASRNQPTLLFINGELQGIYMLRERVDSRFFADNYGLKNSVVVDTPAHHVGEPYVTSWEALIAYVKENDLSQAEHYQHVLAQIDIDNFIDYYLVNLYSANLDWTYANVHQFHEEDNVWKWATWDSDLTFSSPTVDAVNRARTFDHPLAEGMVAFFNALLKNENFQQAFEARANELFATVLSAENVQNEIQLLAAMLQDDIYLEKNRWSIEREWDDVVGEMVTFAAERPGNMQSNIANSLQTIREE